LTAHRGAFGDLLDVIADARDLLSIWVWRVAVARMATGHAGDGSSYH
jgi:hypothetical protein